jgi:RHS repeat-associated protein
VAKIIVGSTTPLEKIRPDEASFFLYDHLGNTRVAFMVNQQAVPTIINAMDYFSYGKILREFDGGAGDRYLTTNHERDKETGLDYRGARYYDSDVARFLSTDPWADKYPSWSTYNYVMGNPTRLTDPTGKGVKDIIIRNIYKDENGKEQNFSVTYKDGKLYNMSGEKYKPKKGGFIETVAKQLDQLKKDGDKPKTVVETLENSAEKHIITNGPDEMMKTGNKNGEGEGGEGSITYYDAFSEYRDGVKDANNKRDPRVGLIHELTHAYDRQTGVIGSLIMMFIKHMDQNLNYLLEKSMQ